jgi:hypothetical protein
VRGGENDLNHDPQHLDRLIVDRTIDDFAAARRGDP